MEKVFKAISNSLLTVFLFGLMLLPIVSMVAMGVKPQTKEVLSAQDETVVEEVKQTTESSDGLTGPEQINY